MKLYFTDPTSHQANGELYNLGDIIIKQAIAANIQEFGEVNWIAIDQLSSGALPPGSLLILAGANILANNPFFNTSVWRPPLSEYLRKHYVLLFGIGWWQYQDKVNALSQAFYRRALVQDMLHSVRDGYTARMLASCGVQNVLNTGCPTMWKLNDEYHFGESKPGAVVFTLTDYYRDREHDQELVRMLLDEYEEVRFFPQGIGDCAYLSSLGFDSMRIRVLERSLDAFDGLLQSDPIDYVGTRLHAGIRALQNGRRAFVVSVDNRATEISRDTGLPVVERAALGTLRKRIQSEVDLNLRIERQAIGRFKASLPGIFAG